MTDVNGTPALAVPVRAAYLRGRVRFICGTTLVSVLRNGEVPLTTPSASQPPSALLTDRVTALDLTPTVPCGAGRVDWDYWVAVNFASQTSAHRLLSQPLTDIVLNMKDSHWCAWPSACSAVPATRLSSTWAPQVHESPGGSSPAPRRTGLPRSRRSIPPATARSTITTRTPRTRSGRSPTAAPARTTPAGSRTASRTPSPRGSTPLLATTSTVLGR